MGEFKMDEELTKRIMAKRAQSEPLTDSEENYARKLFDAMMASKKSVQKTVRIVTGTDLRKENVSDLQKIKAEEPTRPYNFPAQGKALPKENPNAQPDDSLRNGEKLPDVDNKPKETTTENQRLSDITQQKVDPMTSETQNVVISTEPAAKFQAADPVRIGDAVIKNFARVGQLLYKGVVLNIDTQGRAVVKWANGMQTFESAYLLVKCDAAAPATSVKPAAEVDRTTEYPVSGKVKTEKIQKDEDIVPEPMGAPQPPVYCTPFQELVQSLERVVALAADMKMAQGRISDPEVVEYYDQLIGDLRQVSETILSALSMELSEAQDEHS